MILCVFYVNLLHFIFAEWIEIPQMLPRDKTESVTKPPLSIDQLPASNSKFTTYATTEFRSTETYVNETLGSASFNGRINEDNLRDDKFGKDFGFVNFIEDVQNKLLKHNHRTFKSKMEILLDLKRNLLYNIKDKITNLWSPNTNDREARELHEKEDDYHMDFPSNEGALMTIGFLTFAVFLIKLVLKLITALKNHKNGGISTTTVAPATVLIGRKKRSVHDDTIRILRYIDEFNFK